MDSTERDSASKLVSAWTRADAELNAVRLQKLVSLDEREAARMFARISCDALRVPMRMSSGLVDQQAIFRRLYDGARCAVR
jgi:hypothetical protein